MEIALLAVLVGLGIGLVVGALGAGGGILAVPVLVYLLGQDPHAATASSLVIVGITAAFSIVHHARTGNVAWREGGVFALVSIVGAVLGSRLSVLVPSQMLMVLFGVMLAVVAVVMVRRAIATRRAEDARTGAAPEVAAVSAGGDDRPISWPALVITATFTGLLTGFFGVGGGFIVVPMLVIALGLAMRRASGTSLLVMIIVTVAALAARLGTHVEIDWVTTLLFAAGSSVGGILGGPLSAKARPSTLTWAFAVLLGVVALVVLGDAIRG